MQDYFEQKREKIAVELIAQWKANESKLMSQYGSREDFFSQEMARRLWGSARVRAEFADKETLQAFLANESRAKEHKRGLSSHKKPENLDDDASGADDALKAKWNGSKSLQDEFDGDFEAYRAYELNKNRVKVMN